MSTEWEKSNDLPRWSDDGARIEIRDENGEVSQGTLKYVDEVDTDEDCFPIYSIILDDGTEVSFSKFHEWRKL